MRWTPLGEIELMETPASGGSAPFAERRKGARGVRREADLAMKSERLAGWVAKRLPGVSSLTVSPLRGEGEGFSNETYFFDIAYRDQGEDRSEELVIRWLPTTGSLFPDQDLRTQYRVMAALASSKVPVPTMRWYESDASVLGTEFFVMDRVAGTVPAGRLRSEGLFYEAAPEARTELSHRVIESIAGIHDVDWRELGLQFLGVAEHGTGPINRQIAACERLLVTGEATGLIPVFDRAIAWLKANTFAPESVQLCWGDARPGNLIYRNGEVVAVLDWEMAYLGDPVADLAWLVVLEPTYAWPFGAPPLDGMPDEGATVEHYEYVTGRRVENMHFHKVLALLRLGALLVPHARNIERAGIRGYPADFMTNNVATQGLEQLLSDA